MDVDFDMIPTRLRDAPIGERALLYARLFWPDFIEIEGMVFLEGAFEDEEDMRRLREALDRYGGDREQVERSFNFHELDLLFGGLAGTSEQEDEWLAEQIVRLWRARLDDLFPTKQFRVEVVRPTPSEGHEIGVIFFQDLA